jgi:hypothetical protein
MAISRHRSEGSPEGEEKMTDENRDYAVYFVKCPDVLYGADAAHHYILQDPASPSWQRAAPGHGQFQCRGCGERHVVSVTEPWKTGYVSSKERDQLIAYSKPNEAPTAPQDTTMNPDGYDFLAYCKECQEMRSVCCSRTDAQKGNPVRVMAIACGHTWILTAEETAKVRKQLAAVA